MPQFEVTQEEWRIAHQYLDNAPDGTKLPYSVQFNHKKEIISRKRFETHHKPYQTFHSFIKMNGMIFVFQNGHLSEGSINKAKYVMNEQDELFVVKLGDEIHKLKESETTILADLQLSKGLLQRLDKKKQYIFMYALGVSLNRLFKNNEQPKKLEERLDMAIQLSWKLYRLHEGHDSLTHTPYAHMDIKPDNVTMTKDGELHIIDFGMAEQYPKQAGRQKTQARLYVAYKKQNQVLTKEQYDVIAIKRIIYLPDSLYGGSARFIENIHKINHPSLLNEQELNQLQLNEYINTFALETDVPDYTQDKTSAIILCALLINAKYGLQIEHQKLFHDPILIYAIVGFYFNDQIEQFTKLISDATAIKLMAALTVLDIHKQYNTYCEDSVLLEALTQSSTLETMCALINLKIKGLGEYYTAVLQSNELSEVVNALNKPQLLHVTEDLSIVINDTDKNIVKAILFLKRHHLEYAYIDVLKHPTLAKALINMTSKECETSVIHMFESNGFTPDEIIKVASDQRLAKSANLIKKNVYVSASNYIEIVKLMMASDQHVEACLNMDGLESFHDYEKAKILANTNICMVFNFLFPENIKDKAMLNNIIYNNNVADVFVSLQQRKMAPLYLRALQDYEFTFEIKKIFSADFANEVTIEMLSNDKIRKFLWLNSSTDTCFKTLVFLKNNGFANLLKWVIDYPGVAYHLKNLLKPEDSFARAFHVSFILEMLPREKRFEFIEEIANVLDIKTFKSEGKYLHKIKLLLQDDKQAFLKMIYNNEELADKQTLKNIKSTIKKTHWSYGYLDPKIHIFAMNVEIPVSVTEHVNILRKAKNSDITYPEAVCEIKKIGREQCEVRQKGMLSYYRQSFFGKSETEKYFELFETEESFTRAFVKK